MRDKTATFQFQETKYFNLVARNKKPGDFFMKIIGIDNDSIAAQMGLQPGDEVLSINDQRISDRLDFDFWFYTSDQTLLTVRRNSSIIEYEFDEPIEEDLGIKFEPLSPRCCGNQCIFCFTDQNPPGLRSSLYFKDEDYRFSFLHGNYVTLTNVSWRDLRRIAAQRMSPLYISVHAIEPGLRRELFGLRKDDRLVEKIKFLIQAEIELHAQIVLCPGLNDGDHLERTVWELAQYYPSLRTIAIVPVGLTRYRQNLPKLSPFTATTSAQVIARVEAWGQKLLKKLGARLVYLADEFYLQAGQPIPAADYYDSFDQLENGVGMVRSLLSEAEAPGSAWPSVINRKLRATIVTGEMAFPIINDLVDRYLRGIQNLLVQVIAIQNNFFGPLITVSGLLTGQDIYAQLSAQTLGDEVWLPPNCINDDGIFLDDWTPEQLEQKLNCKVKVLADGFMHYLTKSGGKSAS